MPFIKSIDDSNQKYKRKLVLAERQINEPGSLPLPKYAGVFAKRTRENNSNQKSVLTNNTMNQTNSLPKTNKKDVAPKEQDVQLRIKLPC